MKLKKKCQGILDSQMVFRVLGCINICMTQTVVKMYVSKGNSILFS
jgi:hypothetical protein